MCIFKRSLVFFTTKLLDSVTRWSSYLFALNNRVVDKSKDKKEQKGRIHFLFWRQMPSFWFFMISRKNII